MLFFECLFTALCKVCMLCDNKHSIKNIYTNIECLIFFIFFSDGDLIKYINF